MTIAEIREIIQLLTETGVAEIEVQRGENRVWIKGATSAQEMSYTIPQTTVGGTVAFPASPPALPLHSTPTLHLSEENLPVVKAPIVGTFYESPSPGSPPFVKVGDTVQPGQVICIIESMKLMNEIEAESAGVIASKLVSNGKPVEYGETLFTYRPI